MLLKDCAGADRATIILLKAHLRRAGRIRYTGRTHDANKLVHIMPLCTHVHGLRVRARGLLAQRSAEVT